MDQVTLRAEPRIAAGTRPARRLRRTGSVPAVLYGRGLDPRTVSVDKRDLYGVLHTEAGANALINLEVEGEKNKFLTVAREVQRDPVRGEIIHLDFISISLDEPIAAEVYIEYLGIPAGVEEGGVVETIRTAVNVMALPMEIPASIPLDISAMVVGDTMKIADLPAIDGVEYTDDPDASLATVIVPKLVEEAVPEVEEGEEVEGEMVDEEGEPIEPADGEGDDEPGADDDRD
jgi:large subunit ribosomal protein L25